MPIFYMPTKEPESWKAGLADLVKHWKPGYSAYALAHAWEDSKGFPSPQRPAQTGLSGVLREHLVRAVSAGFLDAWATANSYREPSPDCSQVVVGSLSSLGHGQRSSPGGRRRQRQPRDEDLEVMGG